MTIRAQGKEVAGTADCHLALRAERKFDELRSDQDEAWGSLSSLLRLFELLAIATQYTIYELHCLLAKVERLSSSPIGGRQVTLKDFAIVCSNCHVMIHIHGKCRPLNGLIP